MQTLFQIAPDGGRKNLGDICVGPGAAAAPSVTPAMVLNAFRKVPLPASTLTIAPKHGVSLVNFDTVFSTQATEFRKTVTLLGRPVELDISPTSYTWNYGDGASETTDWPGRAYRAGLPISAYLTHRYLDASVLEPSVDTTWSARWRVGRGAWRPVDGTVTIAGTPQRLTVDTATPTLVS